jgi:hypothetical protein
VGTTAVAPAAEIYYPESDGEPLADDGKQFMWIVLLYANLAALYRDVEDVYVSGNQNWLPREYEPETNRLLAYARGRAALRRVPFKDSYTSPRLGIRFDLTGPEMVVFHPDGRRFLTYEELEAERAERVKLLLATQQKLQTAEQKLQTAEQRAARLAELSGKLLRQQATPEEILELQSLLAPPASP